MEILAFKNHRPVMGHAVTVGYLVSRTTMSTTMANTMANTMAITMAMMALTRNASRMEAV